MNRRPFSSEEDSFIRTTYSTLQLAEIARSLGRTSGSVQSHTERLIRLGVLQRSQRAYHSPWTPEDLALLEKCIERGMTDAVIGKRLGRTATSVQVKRKRSRIAARRTVLLSARAVADRMGVSCSKTVAWWIRQGWLKGRKGQRAGPNRMWYVTEDALQCFMEDAVCWHLWEPKRSPNPDWRSWALDLRRGAVFLSVGEVARRFGYEIGTVNQWINRGLLPAKKRGPTWRVLESDLTGFVPPGEMPHLGRPPKRFTPNEDRWLVRLRCDEGLTLGEVAEALERNPGSVAGRLARLSALDPRLRRR